MLGCVQEEGDKWTFPVRPGSRDKTWELELANVTLHRGLPQRKGKLIPPLSVPSEKEQKSVPRSPQIECATYSDSLGWSGMEMSEPAGAWTGQSVSFPGKCRSWRASYSPSHLKTPATGPRRQPVSTLGLLSCADSTKLQTQGHPQRLVGEWERAVPQVPTAVCSCTRRVVLSLNCSHGQKL